MIETFGSIIVLLLFIIMLLLGVSILLLALIAGVGLVKPKKRKKNSEEPDEILFIPKEGGMGSVRIPNDKMDEFLSKIAGKARESGTVRDSEEEKKPETLAGYL